MSKLQKTFLAIAFILSGLCCAACGDDNESGGGGDDSSASITVPDNARQHEFAKTGGTWDFSVQATSQPKAESSASWLTVTSVHSASSSVFKFRASAEANQNTDDRTATITLSIGSVSEVISIIQTSEDGLIVETTTYEAIADGENIAVKLKANGEFTTSIDCGWITESTTRANMQEYTRTFTVAKNYTSEQRQGVITFTLNELTESVIITQKAGEAADMSHSATQLSKLMYPGWNLGNTMEAGDRANNFTNNGGLASEVSWQRTMTTQEVIDAVSDAGFRAVRLPAAWVMGHITDADAMTLDKAWVNRVKDIVDYCIKDGLYVVLNDHWDGGWIEVEGFSKSTSKYEAVSESDIQEKISTLKKLWTNIAKEFGGYDEHLLFAGLNEPFQEYSLFSTKHEQLTPILERYNQAFVDAVRATGGNNASRVLVVQGPSTNIASTYNYMHLPSDAANGRLMVEVHYYDPWNFASGEQSWYYWGADNHVAGSSNNCTYGEEAYMKAQLELMRSKFTSKSVPVIIGEYAADRRVKSDSDFNQTKHDASIKLFYKLFNQYCTDFGIVPFAWDTNSNSYPSGTIINRTTGAIFNEVAYDGIKEGVSAGVWPY